MTVYLIIGSDTNKSESYSPEGIPNDQDDVVTNPSTPDFNVDDNFKPRSLRLTEFTKDIYYKWGDRDLGIIRNDEKYEFFIDKPEIQRVD